MNCTEVQIGPYFGDTKEINASEWESIQQNTQTKLVDQWRQAQIKLKEQTWLMCPANEEPAKNPEHQWILLGKSRRGPSMLSAK